MAGRIRSIKPELREHLPFASLTDRAARLFLMLYTLVDDKGRCPASPGYLVGQIFFVRPLSLNVIGKAIAELEAADLVKIYKVKDAPFLEIVGWRSQEAVTHQRIDKPQPGRFPAPEWDHSKNGSENGSENDSKTDLDLIPGPVPVPGPGPIAELQAMLAALPAWPDGLRPPASGKALGEMRRAIESGALTIAECTSIARELHHDCTEKRRTINGRRHLDNLLASWVRAAIDRKSESSPPKKPDFKGGWCRVGKLEQPELAWLEGAEVPRRLWMYIDENDIGWEFTGGKIINSEDGGRELRLQAITERGHRAATPCEIRGREVLVDETEVGDVE